MLIMAWGFRVVIVPFFFACFLWAAYKWNVTGDGRWWMTILFSPFAAWMTWWLSDNLLEMSRPD